MSKESLANYAAAQGLPHEVTKVLMDKLEADGTLTIGSSEFRSDKTRSAEEKKVAADAAKAVEEAAKLKRESK